MGLIPPLCYFFAKQYTKMNEYKDVYRHTHIPTYASTEINYSYIQFGNFCYISIKLVLFFICFRDGLMEPSLYLFTCKGLSE